MKTKIKYLLAAALFCGLLTATAQVPVNTNAVVAPSLKSELIGLVQSASTAREVTAAAYPSYAPGIIKGEGQFGIGIAVLVPILPTATSGHLYSGIRLDYIGHSWSAATVGVGLKMDIQVLGHNFTPFTTASAFLPMTGKGSVDVGALIGGGVATDLWKSPSGKWTIGLFVQSEYSTQFNTMIYHGGPLVNFKF